MAFDIDAALRYVVEREGSDLHVKVASPPMARVHGALRPIEGTEPLTEEDTEGALEHILRRRAAAGGVRQRGRGRLLLRDPRAVALPGQRLSPAGLRLDRLPRDPLPGADDRRPRAARGDPQAGRAAARDHPAHRDDRLGQVDDPGGDDRPHQLDPLPPRRHPRGPDRVPAPRQALDHQPARGRSRHRELREGDAPGAAAGPRRDPDRRDARRGDRPHGARRRRDRAPRAVHAAHPRRHRDDQPDRRLLPAAPSAAGAGDARLDPARRGLAAARARGSTATGASPSAR